MNLQFLFYVLAVICWLMGGLNISVPRLNWMILGMFFAGAATWLM